MGRPPRRPPAPPAAPRLQLKGMLPQNTETRLQLPKLRILDLSFNSFPGGIPPGWGLNNSGPHLELVYLRGLGLNGSLPSEWGSGGGLQRLRQLWVDANDLSGTIPASWANLPQLEQLYVKPGNPRLCGPLPPGIKFKVGRGGAGPSGSAADSGAAPGSKLAEWE